MRGLIADFLRKEHTTLALSGDDTEFDLSGAWEPARMIALGFWLTQLPNTNSG